MFFRREIIAVARHNLRQALLEGVIQPNPQPNVVKRLDDAVAQEKPDNESPDNSPNVCPPALGGGHPCRPTQEVKQRSCDAFDALLLVLVNSLAWGVIDTVGTIPKHEPPCNTEVDGVNQVVERHVQTGLPPIACALACPPQVVCRGVAIQQVHEPLCAKPMFTWPGLVPHLKGRCNPGMNNISKLLLVLADTKPSGERQERCRDGLGRWRPPSHQGNAMQCADLVVNQHPAVAAHLVHLVAHPLHGAVVDARPVRRERQNADVGLARHLADLGRVEHIHRQRLAHSLDDGIGVLAHNYCSPSSARQPGMRMFDVVVHLIAQQPR